MKLSNEIAQRLLAGLRTVDADEATKLDPSVKWKLAINIDRLMPVMTAYENTIRRYELEREQMAAQPQMNGFPLTVMHDKLRDLARESEDYKLKKISVADLKLQENPKIKADNLARLAPILTDFDDGEGDD